MALSTTYSIDDVIALPQGTTPWYTQFVDSMKHIKNTMDDVSSLSGGGAPGFAALIDTRWYLVDTSSSTTAYAGVTSPAATGSDSIPAGYTLVFDPVQANTGACTLNIGTSEGATSIKKVSGGSKSDLDAGDLSEITVLAFDGTHWVQMTSAPFNVDLARTWTKAQRGEVTTLTSGSLVAIDFSDSNNFELTCAESLTLSNPSNIVAGQSGSIRIEQDGTGGWTVSFASAWKFPEGTAPTLSTTASAIDRIDYVSLDGVTVEAVATINIS